VYIVTAVRLIAATLSLRGIHYTTGVRGLDLSHRVTEKPLSRIVCGTHSSDLKVEVEYRGVRISCSEDCILLKTSFFFANISSRWKFRARTLEQKL